MDKPLKRFDQEDARPACRVQYPNIPLLAVPWQHFVEHKVNYIRGGIDGPGLLLLNLGNELLIDAANELQRDSVERILLPEQSLLGLHLHTTTHEVRDCLQV